MLKSGLVLLALMLLTGCAVEPVYKPMPDTVAAKTQKVDVVAGVAQKELIAEIVPSNIAATTGGGLLFAAIDAGVNASRSSKAEAAIVPARDSLMDFNAVKTFQDDLRHDVAALPWIQSDKVDISLVTSEDEYGKRIQASSKDAVLFVNMDYRLSPDFKLLKVNAQVYLIPKSEALVRLQAELYKKTTKINDSGAIKAVTANALYRNYFTYARALDVAADDIKAAAGSWAENSGARVKTALSEGLGAISAMVALDLQQTRQMTADEKPEVTEANYDIVVNGKTLQATRSKTGILSVFVKSKE